MPVPRYVALRALAIGVVAAGVPAIAESAPAQQQDAKSRYEAGLAAKKAGEWDTAAAELCEALEMDARYVDAHWALAWVYAQRAMKLDAAEHFRAVVRLVPGTEMAREASNALGRMGLPVGPQPESVEQKTGYTFVAIPAGGTLRAFEIGKHEVTVAQFRKFVEATGHETSAEKDGQSGGCAEGAYRLMAGLNWRYGSTLEEPALDDHPVVHVSRDDAAAFCKWVSGRLPTNDEWEHAARGGLANREFVWGDEWPPPKRAGNLADVAYLQKYRYPVPADPRYALVIPGLDDGYGGTAPVGSFAPNGYGLYDMCGNVGEWVVEEPYRRGGAFDGFLRDALAVAKLGRFAGTGSGGDRIGFRVVKDRAPE